MISKQKWITLLDRLIQVCGMLTVIACLGLLGGGLLFLAIEVHNANSVIPGLLGLGFLWIVLEIAKLEIRIALGLETREPRRPTPIVRAWTHNGVTVVCAEADYQLWQKQRDRGIPLRLVSTERICSTPKYLGFFTDDRSKKDALQLYCLGDMAAYRKIIEGCRVEKTELFIPTADPKRVTPYPEFERIGCEPVGTLQALYFLIHGETAPENLFPK